MSFIESYCAVCAATMFTVHRLWEDSTPQEAELRRRYRASHTSHEYDPIIPGFNDNIEEGCHEGMGRSSFAEQEQFAGLSAWDIANHYDPDLVSVESLRWLTDIQGLGNNLLAPGVSKYVSWPPCKKATTYQLTEHISLAQDITWKT